MWNDNCLNEFSLVQYEIPKPNDITNVDNEEVDFARITYMWRRNDKYKIWPLCT